MDLNTHRSVDGIARSAAARKRRAWASKSAAVCFGSRPAGECAMGTVATKDVKPQRAGAGSPNRPVGEDAMVAALLCKYAYVLIT